LQGCRVLPGYAELAKEESRDRRFNTSILVGPDGRIVGKYRKIHLPGHADDRPEACYQHLEKKYFEVGNLGFNVWKMFKHEVIVGQCICNDRRWPETFRVMGLKGAEMVVLGYNTPSDNVYAPHEPPYLRVFHHSLSIQAAAYQNGIWVLAASKAGKEDGFWLHGGSAIVTPTGEIVAKATTEEDEVISYDCDMGLGEYIRNRRGPRLAAKPPPALTPRRDQQGVQPRRTTTRTVDMLIDGLVRGITFRMPVAFQPSGDLLG